MNGDFVRPTDDDKHLTGHRPSGQPGRRWTILCKSVTAPEHDLVINLTSLGILWWRASQTAPSPCQRPFQVRLIIRYFQFPSQKLQLIIDHLDTKRTHLTISKSPRATRKKARWNKLSFLPACSIYCILWTGRWKGIRKSGLFTISSTRWDCLALLVRHDCDVFSKCIVWERYSRMFRGWGQTCVYWLYGRQVSPRTYIYEIDDAELFDQGRLALKNDPRNPWTGAALLDQFIELNNLY